MLHESTHFKLNYIIVLKIVTLKYSLYLFIHTYSGTPTCTTQLKLSVDSFKTGHTPRR